MRFDIAVTLISALTATVAALPNGLATPLEARAALPEAQTAPLEARANSSDLAGRNETALIEYSYENMDLAGCVGFSCIAVAALIPCFVAVLPEATLIALFTSSAKERWAPLLACFVGGGQAVCGCIDCIPILGEAFQDLGVCPA